MFCLTWNCWTTTNWCRRSAFAKPSSFRWIRKKMVTGSIFSIFSSSQKLSSLKFFCPKWKLLVERCFWREKISPVGFFERKFSFSFQLRWNDFVLFDAIKFFPNPDDAAASIWGRKYLLFRKTSMKFSHQPVIYDMQFIQHRVIQKHIWRWLLFLKTMTLFHKLGPSSERSFFLKRNKAAYLHHPRPFEWLTVHKLFSQVGKKSILKILERKGI